MLTIPTPRSPREHLGFSLLERKVSDQLRGQDVRVLQVEFDLFEDHQSLQNEVAHWVEKPDTPRSRIFDVMCQTVHATAVASIITDREFGVAPDCDFHFTSNISLDAWNSPDGSGIRDAIEGAIDGTSGNVKLRPGDVVSVSVQLPIELPNGDIGRVPIDVDDTIREAINYLTDEMGVLVFLAAGNGEYNLDNTILWADDDGTITYGEVARESKAITVGYCNALENDLLNSNYGNCVDLYWPSESVRSACYNVDAVRFRGDLLDSVSGGFCRSSASTPMLAALAACLQQYHKSLHNNQILTRDRLLELISHQPNGKLDFRGNFVGFKPDLNFLLSQIELENFS